MEKKEDYTCRYLRDRMGLGVREQMKKRQS